jgi:hypothetical protein
MPDPFFLQGVYEIVDRFDTCENPTMQNSAFFLESKKSARILEGAVILPMTYELVTA